MLTIHEVLQFVSKWWLRIKSRLLRRREPIFAEDHPFSLVRNNSTLPTDSFLKSLPLAIAAEQRLVLDAIRVASDFAAAAYVQLVQTALRTASDTNAGANVVIVQNAWSFVDQMYAIRNLLTELGTAASGPKTQAFFAATEEAFSLRNRTDHLSKRIAGIANKNGSERSLFGSVSYYLDPKLIGDYNNDVLVVTHHIEPIRPTETVGRSRTPGDQIRLPCGNFILSADGRILDIDLCIQKLSAMMLQMNDTVEKEAEKLIDRLSRENGLSKEDLSVHFGSGLRTNMFLRRPTAAEFAEIVKTEHGK